MRRSNLIGACVALIAVGGAGLAFSGSGSAGDTTAVIALPLGRISTDTAPVRVDKTTNLLDEGFEGAWPTDPWRLFHFEDAADVDWGRTSYRASTGSYSMWCAMTGPDSPGDGGDVPVNTYSWAMAGPFDLSSVNYGTLSFSFYLDTDENRDEFMWGASTDGVNYRVWSSATDSAGWTSRSYPLDDFIVDDQQNPIELTGQPAVWFAFLYTSDDSTTAPGVWVDDVLITVEGGGAGPSASFTWTPSSPQAGNDVRFTDTSTGSPTTWTWAFGDGGTGSTRNPTHAYATAGTYTVSLTAANTAGSDTATRSITITGGGGGVGNQCTGSYVYIVPAGGHLPGANNTQWVSDLGLNNLGSATAQIDVDLLAAQADNTTVQSFATSVDAFSSEQYRDLILARFGQDNLAGALRICSSQPLQIMSRTYNDAATGTYGQGIPGYLIGEAIQPGQTGRLTFLYDNSSYRTNVGFVSLSASRLEIEVSFHRESGARIGTLSYVPLPYGYMQMNRIFTDVASYFIDNGFIRVSCSTGAFFAYASMIDNRAGDPTFMIAHTE